jgi:hypothetical protein
LIRCQSNELEQEIGETNKEKEHARTPRGGQKKTARCNCCWSLSVEALQGRSYKERHREAATGCDMPAMMVGCWPLRVSFGGAIEAYRAYRGREAN